MARLLVIDDEQEILLLVKNAFRRTEHEVVCAGSPEEAEGLPLREFELILMDVMMPGKDGFAFCSEIRGRVDCPILFLTAKSLEEDVELGFAVGADDYIKKPFSIVELRARVNAHLRREHRERTQSLRTGELCFFLQSRELFAGEERVNLTKSEYAICELLAKQRPQVFSKEQIYEAVFGFEGESDESAIKEHIKNIRRKLAEHGAEPIETVWGIGYRWKREG